MPFKNIYKAENAIKELIKTESNCTSHFNYIKLKKKGILNGRVVDQIVTLELITFNPTHETEFLFHSLKTKNKLQSLNLMYKHIYNLNPRFVEERGSSVYNIKLLADLWSPHLDYFKTIYT